MSLCPFKVHVISLVLLVSALVHVALMAPGPWGQEVSITSGRVCPTCSFKTPLSPTNQVACVVWIQETLWK